MRKAALSYFGFPKPLASKEFQISIPELFASMKPGGPLEEIKRDLDAGDRSSAAGKWEAYISAREDAPLPEHFLVEPLPDREVVEEADLIVQHKIKAWGGPRASVSKDINFISFAKEHRLEELHHLAFLAYLGRACRLTGTTRYITAFEEIVRQWYSQYEKVPTTRTLHPVWNDSGCGIRAMTIIDVYNEMKRARRFSTEFHTIVLRIILSSARWLYRSEEEYRPGSSGFDACAALVLAGTYFPEFSMSSEWVKRGVERIEEKIRKEFSGDGTYMELSDIYSLKVLDRLAYVYELIRHTGHGRLLFSGYARKLAKFAEYFAKTCTPLGTLNTFNDSAYVDITGRLIYWAGLLKRWDLTYPVRELMPPDLRKKSKKPLWGPSVNMAEAGRTVMRSAWTTAAPYMGVEYSPPDIHSHNETTNFAMFAYGRPMIIDRGKGTTYDDPYQLYLRTSRMHSMVILGDDNIDISKKRGDVRLWHAGKDFDCLSLEHEGFKDRFGAAVRRTIVFVKPHYWIISDAVLNPRKSVKATSYFHAYPVLLVREDGNIQCKHAPGFVMARPREKKEEFLKERAVTNMANFDMKLQWTDWVGFQKRARIKKGVTFLTVIYPYEKTVPEINVARIDALPMRGNVAVDPVIAEAFEITTPEGTGIFFISHGKRVKRRYGPVTADAEFGLLLLDGQGKPASCACAHGTVLEYSGRKLYKSVKAATFSEKNFTRSKKR